MTFLIYNDADKLIGSHEGQFKQAVQHAKALAAAYMTEVGGEYDGEVAWMRGRSRHANTPRVQAD